MERINFYPYIRGIISLSEAKKDSNACVTIKFISNWNSILIFKLVEKQEQLLKYSDSKEIENIYKFLQTSLKEFKYGSCCLFVKPEFSKNQTYFEGYFQVFLFFIQSSKNEAFLAVALLDSCLVFSNNKNILLANASLKIPLNTVFVVLIVNY